MFLYLNSCFIFVLYSIFEVGKENEVEDKISADEIQTAINNLEGEKQLVWMKSKISM